MEVIRSPSADVVGRGFALPNSCGYRASAAGTNSLLPQHSRLYRLQSAIRIFTVPTGAAVTSATAVAGGVAAAMRAAAVPFEAEDTQKCRGCRNATHVFANKYIIVFDGVPPSSPAAAAAGDVAHLQNPTRWAVQR